MNRPLVVALIATAVLAGAIVGATLLDGLGNHTFPVTSANPQVQRWFNQGLMLTYGFNHDAARHLASLSKLAADPVMESLTVWDRYPLALAVNIAERTVRAELAVARNDHAAAIAVLREAVQIEDRIPYDEPPGWHAPVRQTLGAVLLAAGQPAEAEAVYLEELRRNPDNGWSLQGLAQSLAAQQRESEAKDVAARQARVWQHADVKLASSRL